MAASEELARRVVEAGRSCSLTTAVLEECVSATVKTTNFAIAL